ncbi:glycosyltransferase [bacterium]
MIIAFIIYTFCYFLIWWTYCGYILLLFVGCLFRGKKNEEVVLNTQNLKVSVLVPFHNEEEFILHKIKNSIELDYKKENLEFVFINGNSTDNSRKIIEDFTSKHTNHNIKILNCPTVGKINQLNFALETVDADIIINTDVDAVLNKQAVIEITNEFHKNEKIAVVGALNQPLHCMNMEKNYWAIQNVARLLESEFYSSSIVIATCYAYRKDILTEFPKDCVADDIYVAFLAQQKKQVVKYISTAHVYEIRAPRKLKEFISHKFRKSNAFIIEILRFLYALPQYRNRWKIMYLTKLLQLIFMPFILILFLGSLINIVLVDDLYAYIIGGSIIFLFINIVIMSFIFRSKAKGIIKGRLKGSKLIFFIITNFILFFSVLVYWIYGQDSSYKKIR